MNNSDKILELPDKDIIKALRRRGILITPMELERMDTEEKWRVLGIEATDLEGKLRFVSGKELDERESRMTEEIKKHGL
ncbi:hypothetical protein KAI56_01245 [Candidatus Parcubacteria bacterium]|nr:hypothetical protein [Candidatus Parcubacteria bacterium]